MSLEKIKRELKEVKSEEGMFTFVDDSIIQLLISLAEHILEANDIALTSTIPEGYLTISEFEKKYIFVAANTLYKYCKHNQDFCNECAISCDGRWYIHESKTIEFLRNTRAFKKRLQRNFFQEKLLAQ